MWQQLIQCRTYGYYTSSLEITIMRHLTKISATKIHKTSVDPVAESSRKFS